MGQADDVERVEAGCRAQPQSLCKRRVAEQGGDAGGGSTLGTQSAFAQMGHIDSPSRSRLSRDIHFEKSPKSTLYDLHQTGTIANMGPQAPMYDLLVQVDPVHWDQVIPDLAKSWQISADSLTYTFSLREGVKFHDGAPLTAEDVVASFTHIIFPPPGVLSPR